MTRTGNPEMPFRPGLLIPFIAGFSLQLFAAGAVEDDVRHWLKKMIQAVHALNYEGTFVYLHDDQLESMRVLHTVDNSGEREHLLSLNGSAREVVRDNASVTCISPDARSVSIGNRQIKKGIHAIFSMDIENLAAYYDFHLMHQTRVAGREVRVVAIIPKDNFRYGYRLYLDQESGLPLKTDMLNQGGKAVSQVMFTELRIDPDIKDIGEYTLNGKEHYKWVYRMPPKRKRAGRTASWEFTALPEGFGLRVHSRKRGVPDQLEVDHFVLSDGLATLSVYIEKIDSEEGLSGQSSVGAVNAYGSQFNGHQITVVGEVPAITVERVAAAIRQTRH